MMKKQSIVGIVTIFLLANCFLVASATKKASNQPNTKQATPEGSIAVDDTGSTKDIYYDAEGNVHEGKVEVISNGQCSGNGGNTPSSNDPRRQKNQITFKPVKVVVQNESHKAAHEAIGKGKEPVKVQNSSLKKKWPAFTDWSNEYFGNLWEASKLLYPVYVANGTIKGYDQTFVPWNDAYKSSRWPDVQKPYAESHIYLGDLLNGQCSSKLVPSQWYARNIDHLNDEILINDVSPMDDLVQNMSIFNENHTIPKRSLVMTSRGASNQLHYDLDDNWIVQVFRSQKVLLFSPEQILNSMYVFPRVHQHWRRSQVLPLMDATDNEFEGISKVHAIEAILDPGDLLFIPRFWGYHIINVESSIFVQVDLPDAESRNLTVEIKMGYLPDLSIPVQKPLERLVHITYGIHRFFGLLFKTETLTDEDSDFLDSQPDGDAALQLHHHKIKNYATQLIKQRYSKLPTSYATNKKSSTEIDKEMRKSCEHAKKLLLKEKKYPQMKDMIDNLTTKAVNALARVDQSESRTIRNLYMADWLDVAAKHAVGDHSKIVSYLKYCFISNYN